MPKQFLMARRNPDTKKIKHVHVIELGFWDLVRMLAGREIETITAEGVTAIRSGAAYSAFNMGAPVAIAPLFDPKNRGP